LFRVLTAQQGDGFSPVAASANTRLVRLSDQFVDELAFLMAEEDFTEREVRLQRAANAWFSAGKWPRQFSAVSVWARLLGDSATAQRAKKKGNAVFAWHGPSRPERVIAHGVGLGSYEAYRRDQGNR
jgi:hypothetical protein